MSKPKLSWIKWLSAGLFFSSSLAYSGHRGPTYLMGSLGDSITSGTFSSTVLKQTSQQSDIDWADRSVDWDVPTQWQNDADIDAELGAKRKVWEEIVRRLLGRDRYRYSWATGRYIDSQATLLRRYFEKKQPNAQIDVRNESIPGAVASELPGQARRLVDRFEKGGYEGLKYVTLLIGANDACNDNYDWGTPTESVAESVYETLSILNEVKQGEKTRVLVLGPPEVAQLGRPEIDTQTIRGKFTCSALRAKLAGLCAVRTSWNGKKQYIQNQQVSLRVAKAVKSAAEKASKRLKNLDIAFSSALLRAVIHPRDLAIDCFHPNFKTHEKFSRLFWDIQPWFKN